MVIDVNDRPRYSTRRLRAEVARAKASAKADLLDEIIEIAREEGDVNDIIDHVERRVKEETASSS